MSRSPVLRPTLLPGLHRIWRSGRTLQLGLDPDRAVLLDLPGPHAADFLDLLDGSRPERSILLEAVPMSLAPSETRALLDALRAAGFLVPGQTLLPPALPEATRRRLSPEATALAHAARRSPSGQASLSPAQILRRRAIAKVVVAGRGRLAAPIAVALAESGIGHVAADVPGPVVEADLPGGPLRVADLGLPRHVAIAAAVQRAAPGTQTRPLRRGTTSLTIQLAYDQPVPLLAARHASRRQPHLTVALREGAAVIGPLVPATGGPCLQCLDLHRRERDPEWPELTTQMHPDAPEPCAITTLLAATAYATAEALTFLDGATPETLGAAVEIAAPGHARRRSWPPHPACGCAAPARRPRPATP
jgi:hypothetical protein